MSCRSTTPEGAFTRGGFYYVKGGEGVGLPPTFFQHLTFFNCSTIKQQQNTFRRLTYLKCYKTESFFMIKIYLILQYARIANLG
jgi:hypothetical protein